MQGVQAGQVGRGDLSAASLELGDDGGVVALVLRVDVRLLQHQAHRHGVLGVDAGRLAVHVVVPVRVLLVRLEDLGNKGEITGTPGQW